MLSRIKRAPVVMYENLLGMRNGAEGLVTCLPHFGLRLLDGARCQFLNSRPGLREVDDNRRIEVTSRHVKADGLGPSLAVDDCRRCYRVGSRQQLDRIRNRAVLPVVLKRAAGSGRRDR